MGNQYKQKIPINKTLLRSLYAKGYSQEQIAKVCNSSQPTIARLMRSWNITTRPPGMSSALRKARRRHRV